jgi:ATP-binding cassette subfamily B multidrug efflux pump
MIGLFSFFENLIASTARPPEAHPPFGLMKFYWYFLRQVGWNVVFLFVAGFAVAIIDATIPVFIGRMVTLVSTVTPAQLMADSWRQFAGMALVLLILRPLALLMQNFISNQTMAPGFGNLIRWQSHWHLSQQSWAFFQSDLAGVLANRVVQTGPCLRETVILATNAVWYILVYGGSAIVLVSSISLALAAPIVCWFAWYSALLWYFVPRIRVRSRHVSTARSRLTGRIVDCYANVVTIKLFARGQEEDSATRNAIDDHTGSYRRHLRLTSMLGFALALLNALMITSSAAVAVMLWRQGTIAVGTIAMVLPLTWQIANIAGWVAQQSTALFENLGAVEDGMKTIAAPRPPPDKADAREISGATGRIVFESVRFGYGAAGDILRGVDLSITAGTRVGIVGASGSGKSTLVHLLLRLYEPGGGRIMIDDCDIADVTLESLRSQIAMVTQDTSLLNRSIRDNIRLGKAGATDEEIKQAAESAFALDFIEATVDDEGRRGLDAHVGDRGLKLSGGQRQRIGIARAILKNAPILILDEAMSTLDSKTEAAVQACLYDLTKGRTVLAIVHGAIRAGQFDRVIRLENGRIAEVD